ncbi:hypothetical protein PHJA_002061900 [Phtheirospermum japonicum]|uniref:F-box associated beta-propeller type 3 domain-containing protein n=1 Tax=Phtheirospermum japonicum TaxID=374723 RepID=A0A830CHK2_9LAMI|nr:hypothetical protein PHJA_002061900 [Phtheirospermum japonicum]
MVLGSTPLHYKIIRLSKEPRIVKDNSVIRCEIFDSKCWAWRGTQRSLYLPCPETTVRSHPAIRAGKSVHWLTYDDNVVSFHEADESFDKFSLPQPVCKSFIESAVRKSKKLVNYKGTLGLTCLREQDNVIRDSVMELWIIEDYNTYRWTVEMSVSISGLESSCKFPYPAGFYNAGTAFFKTTDGAVFYRLGDRSIRKVELGMDMIGKCEFFQFRSDLEPVDLKGGRG